MKKIILTGALLLGMQYGYAKADMEQMMGAYQQGNYALALTIANENLNDEQKSAGNKSLNVAMAHNMLGMILNNLYENKKAVEHYEKAIAIYNGLPEKEQDMDTLETSYNNLASIYSNNKKTLSKALELYKKVLVLREDSSSVNHAKRWKTALFMARVFMQQGAYGDARDYLIKANDSSSKLSDKIVILDNFAQLGEVAKYYKLVLAANQELLKIVKQFEQTPEILEAIKGYEKSIIIAKGKLKDEK